MLRREALEPSGSFLQVRNNSYRSRRELVVGASVELAPIPPLADASPLLEEERDTCYQTLVPNAADPIRVDRSCFRTALAAHDYPMDTLKIDRSKVFQEWLDREETDPGRCLSQMLDPRHPVLAILDAYAPPDM